MNNDSDIDFSLMNNFTDILIWKGIFTHHPEVTSVYGKTESLTGYTSEELLSKAGQIISIIHEEDIHDYKKKLDEAALDNTALSFKCEFRIITKDESVICVREEISFERNEAGVVTAAAALITNIDKFKQREAELLKNSQFLSELNSSKDKFISILSHDLRSPFTSILGFSEILMSEPYLSESERNEYLNYIHESSNNQLQLINYLLDWSRLQTGRIKVELKRLQAQSLVYNCISSLTGNAMRKNIEIKVHVPEQLYINVDERLMTQVITNLLSNAIKFSPDSKKIEICADVFNDDKTEFIIKDHGIGIPEINKSKIFKVDKIFSTEGTKGEKGTGLGLSLVKEIIDKHNGEIWFYSSPDNGSEFHFTVPFSKSKILVIENDQNTLNMIEDAVTGNFPEFEIVFKKNAYEAISLINTVAPALVILNHDLPFMDGIQLVKLVRESEKGFRIPVIVMMDEFIEKNRIAYASLDVSSFLRRPVEPAHLNRELNIAIDDGL